MYDQLYLKILPAPTWSPISMQDLIKVTHILIVFYELKFRLQFRNH